MVQLQAFKFNMFERDLPRKLPFRNLNMLQALICSADSESDFRPNDDVKVMNLT